MASTHRTHPGTMYSYPSSASMSLMMMWSAAVNTCLPRWSIPTPVSVPSLNKRRLGFALYDLVLALDCVANSEQYHTRKESGKEGHGQSL